MSYTDRLRVTIPPELLEVGKAITRALDPDVGGVESWTPVRDDPADLESPVISYVADTPCTAEFKEQASAMLANPEMLHGIVTSDYLARWPELSPPSLSDCEAFCSALVIDPS